VAPAAAGETAPANAPDVVLMKTGDLFRGTIAERLQSETTVVLMTGETRRIPATEVHYAGPSQQTPKPEPAPAADDAETSEEEENERSGSSC
jgi:hypothetical protein